MLTTGKEKYIASYITITDGNGELTELTNTMRLIHVHEMC